MIFYPDIETFFQTETKPALFKISNLVLIQSQEATDANRCRVVQVTHKCNRG